MSSGVISFVLALLSWNSSNVAPVSSDEGGSVVARQYFLIPPSQFLLCFSASSSFLLLNSYFLISRSLGYFENLDLLGDATE
jgi:hypothetical protein